MWRSGDQTLDFIYRGIKRTNICRFMSHSQSRKFLKRKWFFLASAKMTWDKTYLINKTASVLIIPIVCTMIKWMVRDTAIACQVAIIGGGWFCGMLCELLILANRHVCWHKLCYTAAWIAALLPALLFLDLLHHHTFSYAAAWGSWWCTETSW